MDLAIQAYIKGDTNKGSEKTTTKNVYTKINFTYAIPCNEMCKNLVSLRFKT